MDRDWAPRRYVTFLQDGSKMFFNFNCSRIVIDVFSENTVGLAATSRADAFVVAFGFMSEKKEVADGMCERSSAVD